MILTQRKLLMLQSYHELGACVWFSRLEFTQFTLQAESCTQALRVTSISLCNSGRELIKEFRRACAISERLALGEISSNGKVAGFITQLGPYVSEVLGYCSYVFSVYFAVFVYVCMWIPS
jgi:hypothetical protein